MVRHNLVTPTTTELVDFMEKAWIDGGDWAGVLATQKLLATNKSTPFPNYIFVRKLQF